jgi:thiol-disulfide isomerase/thioredoxin
MGHPSALQRPPLKTLLLCLACLLAPPLHAAPKKAQAPQFSLKDASGVEWTRSAGDAKPLLIDFWATWCAPCLDAMPDLNNFYRKHGAKVGVLGASVDSQGWPVITPMVRRYDLKYPVVAADEKLAKDFGCKGYPCSVLLVKGRVLKTLTGRKRLRQLEKDLGPWL